MFLKLNHKCPIKAQLANTSLYLLLLTAVVHLLIIAIVQTQILQIIPKVVQKYFVLQNASSKHNKNDTEQQPYNAIKKLHIFYWFYSTVITRNQDTILDERIIYGLNKNWTKTVFIIFLFILLLFIYVKTVSNKKF